MDSTELTEISNCADMSYQFQDISDSEMNDNKLIIKTSTKKGVTSKITKKKSSKKNTNNKNKQKFIIEDDDENIENNSNNFNIIEVLYNTIKNDSNHKLIFEIFLKNPYKKLKKREIEKRFGLKVALRNIDMTKIKNMDDIIEQAEYLPGDLQRDLRIFYDKYSKYGLIKEGTTDPNYYWAHNISEIEYEHIAKIKIPDRNIFKTNNERQEFIKKYDSRCQICLDPEKLAIDHWRPYKNYKIDNIGIAVLLCENCNNIHGDRDGSVFLKKYPSNINIINRWIEIEKNIRSNGFNPNKEDIITQNENIEHCYECLKNNGANFEKILEMKL